MRDKLRINTATVNPTNKSEEYEREMETKRRLDRE